MSAVTSILGIRPSICTTQFPCVFFYPLNPSWFLSDMSSYSSKNSCGKLRVRSVTVHVGGMTARFGPDTYKPQHAFRGVRGCEQAGGFTDINDFSDINAIVVFLNVTPCSLVDGCQRYEETYCLHLRLSDMPKRPTWPPCKQQIAYKMSQSCVSGWREDVIKSVTKLISCTQVWYMAICPGRGALSAGSWPLAACRVFFICTKHDITAWPHADCMAGMMRWVKQS